MNHDEKAKVTIGCVWTIFQLPASIVWWVLFGFMLHRTEAATWEWALYVGYLVLSTMSIAAGSLWKLIGDGK